MNFLENDINHITQGSIVDGVDWGEDKNDTLGIVISNACDFEHDNIGFVVTLPLLPASAVIQGSKEFQSQLKNVAEGSNVLSKGASKSIINILEKYIYNKAITRYYLIDPKPLLEAPCLMADFQQMVSTPISKIDSLIPIAKLKSPFIEQMMVQFASYTSRIPSDRVEEDHKTALIKELTEGWTLNI